MIQINSKSLGNEVGVRELGARKKLNIQICSIYMKARRKLKQ